jgi:hypothetical protein
VTLSLTDGTQHNDFVYLHFIRQGKMPNFSFGKFIIAKMSLPKIFSDFFFYKKLLLLVFLLFLYFQINFRGWVHLTAAWASSPEGRVEYSGSVGLAPCSQTFRSLWRTPWPEKPAETIWQNVIWLIHFNGKIFDQ